MRGESSKGTGRGSSSSVPSDVELCKICGKPKKKRVCPQCGADEKTTVIPLEKGGFKRVQRLEGE